MKKAVKGIIGLGAVLVVLGGGLAALKLTESDNTEGSSSSESSEVSGAGTVILEDADIKSVNVKNMTTEFTVLASEASADESYITYTLEGYEDLPLNTSVIGTIANNVKGLSSNAIAAEDCDDLSKYGLSIPQITAEINYSSGESVTLLVGDNVPTGTDYYVKTSESNTVYTVSASTLANYSKTVEEFVSSTILEEPAEEDYPKINSLRIERGDIDYDIYLEYDPKSDDDDYIGGTSATHIMLEPTYSLLSVDDSVDITNGMFGLTSEGVYKILPTEADIAEAGLSDAFCTVTMKCDDGNNYVLKMSESYKDENGDTMYYAMLEGTNVIYIVSDEDAKWASVDPIQIASKIIFGTFVWNITDMKITGKDFDDVEFKLTKINNENSGSNVSAEDYSVVKNGEEFESERFRLFYQFLLQSSAEEFALDVPVPDTEPIASISYTESYDGTTKTVEFYEYSALSTLIVVDGESKYLCSKSYAETIPENVKKLDTGEDFTLTWK